MLGFAVCGFAAACFFFVVGFGVDRAGFLPAVFFWLPPREAAAGWLFEDDLRLRDVAFFFAKGSLHRLAGGVDFELAEDDCPSFPDDRFSLCSLPEWACCEARKFNGFDEFLYWTGCSESA